MSIDHITTHEGEITEAAFAEWSEVFHQETTQVFDAEGESTRYKELQAILRRHVVGQLILFEEK